MPDETAAGITATAPLTVSSLLGREVLDASGRPVGRIVDLAVAPDAEGRMRITHAIVTSGPWGRLLGYERAEAHGPWLVEALARAVLRRSQHRIPWNEVTLSR